MADRYQYNPQAYGNGYWVSQDRRNDAIRQDNKRREQVKLQKEQAKRNAAIAIQDAAVAVLNEQRRQHYVPRSQRRRKYNMQSYSRELVLPSHDSPDLQIG